MSALPFQRLDWIVAWRHLRASDEAPAWVRWVNYTSLYLLVVGALVAWYGATLPSGEVSLLSPFEPPVSETGPTPLQQYYASVGGLTALVGAMGLTLGLLGGVFNLLPTIITMSVLLGCMALVVVLSLMSGLEEDLREKILSQKAHVRISMPDGSPFADYAPLVRALSEGEGIAGASPYLEGEIMVRSGLNRHGAILAGILPSAQAEVSDLPKLIEAGEYRYLEHPAEIPDLSADPFDTFDSTPRRLRHLKEEREKNAAKIREALRASPSAEKAGAAAGETVRATPSDEEARASAAKASEAAAQAAEAAAQAAEAAAQAALLPSPVADLDGEGEDPMDRDDGDVRGLLRALPPPPAPAPRTLTYEANDGWEDPSVEITKLREDGRLSDVPGLPAEAKDSQAPAPAETAADAPEVDERPLDPILIGRELSAELGTRVGSDVQLLTPVGRVTPAGQIPGVLGARVAGVFFSGMYEYDRKNVYAPLDVVQRFLLTGDRVSGVEVKLDDVDAIDDGKRETERIVAALGRTELIVEDWRDLNRNLFWAMFLEKVAMFIALLFVVLVASFGILASNLMSVMEKSKEIAILKAMGMADGAVMRVFIAEGLCVGLLGSFGGIAYGLALCWALVTSGLRLNENMYYIEKLPVVVNPTEVTLIGIAAMVIVCFSSVYPALLAARTRPVDGLRHSAS